MRMEPICRRGSCAEDDPFYRYKMPALRTAVRGNSTVTNLDEIAQALSRDTASVRSFIAKRLGTAVVKDAFRGTFTATAVRAALQTFIEENVLCASCENPETMITTVGQPRRKCRACGATS